MTEATSTGDATAGLHNDSSAETLDQVVTTTSARLWIALVAAMALIVAGVLWAFLAVIPVQTTVTGLVNQPGMRVVVPSPVDGGVKLLATVQSPVTEGDPVAVITPFDLSRQPVTLVSPETGIISGILVQQGSGVAMGQSVFVTSAADNEPQVRVLALVPGSDVDTFSVGESVDVRAAATAASPAQSMPGTIMSVSDVPALLSDVEAVNGSTPLSESLMGAGSVPLYLVVIAVERNDPTGSMRNGEIVTVVNTFDYVHPIDLIKPGAS